MAQDEFQHVLEEIAYTESDIIVLLWNIESRNEMEKIDFGFRALHDALLVASEELTGERA